MPDLKQNMFGFLSHKVLAPKVTGPTTPVFLGRAEDQVGRKLSWGDLSQNNKINLNKAQTTNGHFL